MSNLNPFANPDVISLAELQKRIMANDGLAYPRKREMSSAINTVGVWFGLPLDMIPASATFLRDKFEHVHPAHVNVSKRRVQNVRSLVMSAFRSEGLSDKLAPYMCAMAPEWSRLWDIIDGQVYYRTKLSRLFRYCSKQGILPSGISDAVLSDYLTALEAETLIKNPRTRHQSVCRVWNKCTSEYKEMGWPQIEVTVPKYDERLYSLPWEDIPEAIRSDLDAYLNHLKGDDPFNTQVKPFKPRSIEAITGHFQRYLSALHHQGVKLDQYTSLKELVSTDMFTLGMRWFWDRNGGATSKHIGEIAWAVRCYAVKYLGADEETCAFFKSAIGRLRVSNLGLSDKNQAAMAQFDDQRVVEAYVALPLRLWDKALANHKRTASSRKSKEAQLMIQTAVAIEILIFAPIRIGNLQHLRLDEHITWQAKKMHIHIPKAQVKNDQNLNFLLPESASKRIKTYIMEWRRLFTDTANPYLFPGRKMNPKDDTSLRRQIQKTIWNETGIKLTPHQFRHAAAKILLDAKPGYYEVVRKVLGHKNLSTTYSHYAGAETQAAVELFDEVIIQHRQCKSFRKDEETQRSAEPPFMDPLQLYGGKK
jgi:site-specific recombinase XerD